MFECSWFTKGWQLQRQTIILTEIYKYMIYSMRNPACWVPISRYLKCETCHNNLYAYGGHSHPSERANEHSLETFFLLLSEKNLDKLMKLRVITTCKTKLVSLVLEPKGDQQMQLIILRKDFIKNLTPGKLLKVFFDFFQSLWHNKSRNFSNKAVFILLFFKVR